IVMATLGMAACSGNHASGASDNGPGDSATKVTLDITASLDGRDVTSDSGGMIADSHGNYVGDLESSSDGLEATLAPGKYKVLVTYQGDGYADSLATGKYNVIVTYAGDAFGDTVPVKVLDVDIKPGQTARKKITLDKNDLP